MPDPEPPQPTRTPSGRVTRPRAPAPETKRENATKKLLGEFREFAIKGNVVDMAVGIVVGGAFGTIVKSLVADVIMPPLGLLLSGVDFKDQFFVLRAGNPQGPYDTLELAQKAGAVTLNVGLFFNAVVSFLIVAVAVFFLVRLINRLRREDEAKPAPKTRKCPECALDVPVAARRCGHCTSPIPEPEAAAGEAESGSTQT